MTDMDSFRVFVYKVIKCSPSSIYFSLVFRCSMLHAIIYLPNDLNHLGSLTSSLEFDGAVLKLDDTFEFRLRDDDDVDALFSVLDMVPTDSVVCLMPL